MSDFKFDYKLYDIDRLSGKVWEREYSFSFSGLTRGFEKDSLKFNYRDMLLGTFEMRCLLSELIGTI